MTIFKIVDMPPGEEPNECRKDLICLQFSCEETISQFFYVNIE